ncbi:MAG: two-component system, OmpR family, response regulator [Actinomycetota bacterium]|jgi:CheY-like chemotaxis protein
MKGTVLVVDDDAVTRRVTREMLARLGYDSEDASDGVQALDALRHCAYCAVLMDCFMPNMDGFETTAALRQREGRARHTPVIAMTVSASSETAHRCGAVGADSFLTKPIGMGDLEELLEHWTRRYGTVSSG